jgi:hypothetical protein
MKGFNFIAQRILKRLRITTPPRVAGLPYPVVISYHILL